MKSNLCSRPFSTPASRREFLYGLGASLGSVALTDVLAAEGILADVYDARFAKPVDVDLVASLVARGVPIVTIEDHSIRGGFGSCGFLGGFFSSATSRLRPR